jgi:phage tail-like protein
MTVAFSSQLIQVSLTPMQLPEGNQSNSTSPHRLRVTPGECSQLLVQVKNLTADRHLDLVLRLVGDFPRSWVSGQFAESGVTPIRLGALENRTEQVGFDLSRSHPSAETSEGSIARVENTIEQTVVAGVSSDGRSRDRPSQIFEERTALTPKQSLQIDYRGQVLVYLANSQDAEQAGSLIGSVNFTIHLRPRSLYLDFLPAIYREVDFIGRFLKIFEQSFEPTVGIYQMLWAYLDPNTAPSTLLPFLAYWVGWPGQVPWDELKQRQLIRRALEIYRWRGTHYGLSLYLHLYTGLPQADILIEESFTRSFELGRSQLGSSTMLGSGRPFHFIVRLRGSPGQFDATLIRTIIEQEKPAFCTYELRLETD